MDLVWPPPRLRPTRQLASLSGTEAMTSIPARNLEPDRVSRRMPQRFLGYAIAGIGTGVLVALVLYGTSATVVALLPAIVALVMPAVFIRQFRAYWLSIFLLSTQLPITKNLNDGVKVLESLQIDYTIWNFTFEIGISDLALAILLLVWLNDIVFHGKRVHLPAITWLAVGYIAVATLSIGGSPTPYLGLVELFRQSKLLVTFIYAVNCIDRKSALRILAVSAVTILLVQGMVTILRFQTGLLFPLTFGDVHQDPTQVEQYLSVDRTDDLSAVRAFGTQISPGSTVRLCMMVIPFALLLSLRNPMFRSSAGFAVATAIGLLGLVLTFDRVYLITTGLQVMVVFAIAMRDRILKRGEIVVFVSVAALGLLALSPKIYDQFLVRQDSASVRFLQYEAAFKMILDHPLLGVGLNNATAQQQKYSTLTYKEDDPNTQFYLEPTHNMYLGMASEIGVLGTIMFCAFFAKAAHVAWRMSRRAHDPQIRFAANAFVVVFLGTAVNGMMDPLQEYSALSLLWLYAGICVSLPKMDENSAVLSAPDQFRPVSA